eukprot:g48215.t1
MTAEGQHKYQIDTSASCNIMTFTDLCKMAQYDHPKMNPSKVRTERTADADGLRVLRFFLEQRPEPSPPATTLLCLAELILTLNNFSLTPLIFF